jgi:hypothetical protein
MDGKGRMTRNKVLLIALGMVLLGLLEVVNARGRHDRAAGIGTASGMIAVMSGVGIGLYGLTLKERK